ncbi:MarR family winged helix-turn-helix transcriptional regulator [Phaeacidiphilus oryzae]|uniref:MarR family winged helix-turn-helix transcriptional regulator n=1 Tax=Phaeacidiphilus oryzae TaxID=348818 RepID=UPI00068E0DED|nr:MarR family transcriptional regulator [Phaeacidiphilus oryzae]
MKEEDIELLRAQLKLLQRRLREEALPVTGLSLTAARVLGAVARAPEDAQPRQLGERLAMTAPNVSAALRELEAAHMVTRGKDPSDGRRVRIALTDHGRKTVAHSRRERDTWLGQAIEALLDEAEQQQLSAAGQLMERLAGYRPPAPPPGPPPALPPAS